MQLIRLIVIWLWRAWPILIILFFSVIHFAVHAAIPEKFDIANKIIGTIMQLVGGFIVLHSVNGNLGLFRNQSFFSVIVSWLRDFPLIKRSTVISMASGISATLGGIATVSIEVVATTVEERIIELERRLVEVRNALNAQDTALRQHIDKVKDELRISIYSNESTIKQLAKKLELATVGGFKQQAFGVLLVIYGVVISTFLT